MKERMDAKDYLALPYTKVVRKDDEGDFIARITELPGCVAHGATEAEALEALAEAQMLWIEDAIETDHPVPMPLPDGETLPSGKWVQRVPRRLHQRLVEFAKIDDVSLNQFVTSVLAEAVGVREGRTAPEASQGGSGHHDVKAGHADLAEALSDVVWSFSGHADVQPANLSELFENVSIAYLGEMSNSLPNSCSFVAPKESFDVHRFPVHRVPATGSTARGRTK